MATPILRGAVVSVEEVPIWRCFSLSSNHSRGCGYVFPDNKNLPLGIVGLDPEPFDMTMVPVSIAVQAVSEGMANFNPRADKPHTWTEYTAPGKQMEYFSALRSNTTTGSLRYHALRLNSTVACSASRLDASLETAPQAAPCGGERPFQMRWAGFSRARKNVTFNICVPGKTYGSPWTASRDRVDIQEELMMEWREAVDRSGGRTTRTDRWMRVNCTAKTSRGYFELPNEWNGRTPGPLLQKWPEQGVIRDSYHDQTNSALYVISHYHILWLLNRDQGWTSTNPHASTVTTILTASINCTSSRNPSARSATTLQLRITKPPAH